jgi:hypothetical protein
MRLPALYRGQCKGLSIAEGPLCFGVARAKGRSVHYVASPWGAMIEHSALSDQRTLQSPIPPAPLRRSPAPRVFCGAFVFRNRGEVFFRLPFISILIKPADLCQSVGGTGSGELRACWSQVPGPPANLGPDHSSGRDLFRQRCRTERASAGAHEASFSWGLTDNRGKQPR